MSNLHELFDEASSGGPPSRLSLDDVVWATRSARRRRHLTALATISALAMAATGIVVVTAQYADHPPSGVAPPPRIEWAGRGDAAHLYLVKNNCAIPASATPDSAPVAPCQELLASNDAGRSWLSRGPTSGPPRVLGPLTLMRYAGDPSITPAPVGDSSLNFEVSGDGGASWTRFPGEGPPIEAIPPGGAIIDGFGTELTVYDPAQGRLRRLAAQPTLHRVLGDLVVVGARHLWYSGINPVTFRPAVAVSHDGGASWTERDLPGAEIQPQATLPNGEIDRSQGGGQPVKLVAVDSTTAYASMYEQSTQPRSPPSLPGTQGYGWYRTYRTTDGGLTWQPVSAQATTPSFGTGWGTADGRVVLWLPWSGNGVKEDRYVVSTDCVTYEPAAPPGLPASVTTVGGSTAYTDNAVYVSDDGWTWREVYRE